MSDELSRGDMPASPANLEWGPGDALRRREHLVSEISRTKKRSSRTLIVAAATVAVGMVAVAGTAAAWSRFATADDPTTAICSPVDSLLPEYQEKGSAVGPASPVGGERPAVDAVAGCALAWRYGIVHAPGTTPSPGQDNRVPTLTACITPDRVIVVFPAPAGVCDRLGLQIPAEP